MRLQLVGQAVVGGVAARGDLTATYTTVIREPSALDCYAVTEEPQRELRVKVGDEWLDIPLPAAFAEGLIWHYTDAAGVLGILSSHCLWATNAAMLNDHREIAHGMEVMDEVFNALRSAGDLAGDDEAFVADAIDMSKDNLLTGTGVFVISASRERNSLSQWRAYGGYAVGLDPTVPLAMLVEGERFLSATPLTGYRPEDLMITGIRATRWLAVLYDDDEQRGHAERVLRWMPTVRPRGVQPGSNEWARAANSGPFIAYASAVTSFKHGGFEDEREVRLTAFPVGVTDIPGTVSHRAGTFGIVPYLRVTGIGKPSTPIAPVLTLATKAESLPIQDVVIGPCRYPETAGQGLISALEHHGYDAGVFLSSVPYR